MFRLLSVLIVLVALAVSVSAATASAKPGTGRVGGKMHLDDVSLGIITDKSVPKLLEAATKGAAR
jgi:hypothetical protein